MSKEVLPILDPQQLPNDAGVLKSLVEQLIVELTKSRDRITQLEHHMHLLVRKMYGRSSEKQDPHQQPLFDKEAETTDPLAEVQRLSTETTTTTEGLSPTVVANDSGSSPTRNRRPPRPDNLERREVIHDLTPAEKRALAGEGELVLIGEEVTEQYEWEPSCLYVLRHIQKKYVRRPALLESGNSPETKNVITAGKPPQPIAGGKAGPGLLAWLITSRFCDHLPYHRQERIFERQGLRLSRQTTCDWARQMAELCQPLHEVMITEVLRSYVLHSDDTPVKVRDARSKRQYTGRFWNYVGDEEHPLTVFDYTPDRSRDGPAEFLKKYRGYLQADAYSGYDYLYTQSRGTIIEVACWAHARRNFFDSRHSDALRAETALAFIRQLYAVERSLNEHLQSDWRELSRAERATRIATERQQHSRLVLDQFGDWLEQEARKVLPKHPLRQAIDYVRNQWTALNRFCDDGHLAIDNNAAERAIRGIAIGRRNWLFCGSDRGGETAAVHLSLVATCQRHGIDPFRYLRHVYAQLPMLQTASSNSAKLRNLLPDRCIGS